MISMLFLMIAGHYLADYPLQGDFLAKAKNRNTEVGKEHWKHALVAHSMIHALPVAFVTGSVFLALAEAVVHGLTDYAKCEGKLSLNQDQAIHLTSKVVWAFIAMMLA